MPKPPPEPATKKQPPATAFLRLLVRNHPGVMSHVCGMFARRACNVDAILCMPVDDGARSAILLAIVEDGRVEQMMRHLDKLEDVVEVDRAPEALAAFTALRPWLR